MRTGNDRLMFLRLRDPWIVDGRTGRRLAVDVQSLDAPDILSAGSTSELLADTERFASPEICWRPE